MSAKISQKIADLGRKAGLCSALVKAVILDQTRPLFVGWCITNRCNLQCAYCHSWKKTVTELNPAQAKKIIVSLAKRGTKVIRFTGGEPLLREDLADLIALSKSLGIWTTVATNGLLVPSKIKGLKMVDKVAVSIDGPERIHDALRGKGSYGKAVEACAVLSRENIPISISAVLTSSNLGHVEHVLELAARFRTKAFFQPPALSILFTDNPSVVLPGKVEYSMVLNKLLDLKKKNKAVGNSQKSLKYLLDPQHKKMNCVAGKLFYRIEPQGDMHACPRVEEPADTSNILQHGIDHCLRHIVACSCDDCRSSVHIEMNFLASFDLSVIVDNIKNFG